jgi:EpsD family peptidyl-prolyl cis-trans isomerase
MQRAGLGVVLGRELLLAATVLVSLSSCAKPAPYGQVLAEVGGIDVTQRDLAAELQASGRYDGQPSAVLEQVVERRLLMRAAEDAGIDHSPEFLAASRRAREVVLADVYVRRLANKIPSATPDEINRYIASHPFAFAGRAVIDVERLDVPAATAVAARAVLTSTRSLQEALAALGSKGVKGTTSRQTLDTAALPADTVAALTRTPELFIVSSATGITAFQVLASHPAPVIGDAAKQVAANAITNERLTKQIADRIDTERQQANIRYQAGLGPSSS